MPNFVAQRKNCARYLLWKICAPEKVDQSSTKSLKICYTPMPFIVPNFIALGQMMYEKAIQIFLHLHYFGAQGAPRSKFTDLGTDLQQGSLYQLNKFRPL